ncbi:tyrosinase family protein [Burkholderia ubonensis]|uniref:Tyrosinase n=1 Tax=Burkholderia ubonensis subsp. mesacidophila TaxID=265293 RepID=A0A2A4FEF3_9BURK|nr:tyrosinase family protein [Burkholderia ubonensis]PCE30699.1 tyrosinase [Burkholderia ubonensis subsp. mesacidophila]
MASFVRKDAWNAGGDFNNEDLLWYARGVGKMMERALDDPASWWFFAAIHGEYITPDTTRKIPPDTYPRWSQIKSPPSVPTTPVPDLATRERYWNQCQHGTWYFLPWHRGYLLALEAQLRADIVSLGGPATWALPYWNYFGGAHGADAQMPPAFAQQTMPDGTTPNPLYVAMRYGPDGNGDIYIPTDTRGPANEQGSGMPNEDVTQACMTNDLYTGSDQSTPLPGFGGPVTKFSHSGRHHGNMEHNPHDLVHVYTGGEISDTDFGLMADPGTAGLDPIFYLHHCNIDRMWASWNAAGNANPEDTDWLKGPVKLFVVPMPGGESWQFVPRDVTSLATLDYTYQDLATAVQAATAPLLLRLQKLGVAGLPATVAHRAPSPRATQAPAELLGASVGAVQISGAGTGPISVRLDADVQARVIKSLAQASLSAPPDRVYLQLENVRGTLDSTVLGVYVNLPADASSPALLRAHQAGAIALFGLRRASTADGAHGGDGLTYVLDISRLLDQLYLEDQLPSGNITVTLLARRALPPKGTIEVGRVSVYRQPD